MQYERTLSTLSYYYNIYVNDKHIVKDTGPSRGERQVVAIMTAISGQHCRVACSYWRLGPQAYVRLQS